MRVSSNIFMTVAGARLNASVQATSFNTDAVCLSGCDGYSISAVFSGTTTGTIKLQASNDSTDPYTTPSNFVDISGTSIDLSSGSPLLWNVADAQYAWVRAVHTDTGGGDLTITMRITVKG